MVLIKWNPVRSPSGISEWLDDLFDSIRRQFTLPDEAKEDAIKASYRDGILTIGIPKKEVSVSKRPKQISVS